MIKLINRHHKSFLVTTLLLITSLAMATPAWANNDSPKKLLEVTAQKMFDAINSNRDKIKADPDFTTRLIEEVLLPHIDFITASRYVLGKHWDGATRAQKIGFIKAFRKLLLRFYSYALTEYLSSHDGKLDMTLMSFQRPGKIDNGQVTVRSTVKPKKGKPVPINYQMRKTRKGWKIYDVTIEGISVITTYQTSFASEIKQSGLDSLIASLKQRNKKLSAGDTSVLKTSNKQ